MSEVVADLRDILDSTIDEIVDCFEDLENCYAKYKEYLSKCTSEYQVEEADDILEEDLNEWIEKADALYKRYFGSLRDDARDYRLKQLDDILGKRVGMLS